MSRPALVPWSYKPNPVSQIQQWFPGSASYIQQLLPRVQQTKSGNGSRVQQAKSGNGSRVQQAKSSKVPEYSKPNPACLIKQSFVYPVRYQGLMQNLPL